MCRRDRQRDHRRDRQATEPVADDARAGSRAPCRGGSVKIEQQVEVTAPVERVWAVLDDVPRVAACMPGAAVTKVIDENTYEGTVSMKIGPIAMNYQGTVVIEQQDASERVVRLNASGKDKKGAGSAKVAVLVRLTSVPPEHTELAVCSDLQLSGRVASMGRGVQDIATKLFDEFAKRLSAEAAVPEDAISEAAVPDARAEGGAAAADAPAESTVPAATAAERAPIKVGGLLLDVFREKLRGLLRWFRRSR
ncbi:MAG: hypothetical protein GEU98_24340 [Pseudonocardiaceae bacterium]|nr:hypothetical protein [Pseudonocardiaceae bacterium]